MRRELTTELLQKWANVVTPGGCRMVSRKASLFSPIGSFPALVAIIWSKSKSQRCCSLVRRWPDDEKEAGLLAVARRSCPDFAQNTPFGSPPNSLPTRREWADRDAVREWPGRIPTHPRHLGLETETSTLREQVFANTAITLSELIPAAAAASALQSCPPADARTTPSSASSNVAQKLNRPKKRLTALSSFPKVRFATPPSRISSKSGPRNVEKPADWLASLQEGPVKDIGVSRVRP